MDYLEEKYEASFIGPFYSVEMLDEEMFIHEVMRARPEKDFLGYSAQFIKDCIYDTDTEHTCEWFTDHVNEILNSDPDLVDRVRDTGLFFIHED